MTKQEAKKIMKIWARIVTDRIDCRKMNHREQKDYIKELEELINHIEISCYRFEKKWRTEELD